MWLEVPDLILLYTLFLLNMHMLFVVLWAIRFWHLVMWIIWNMYHGCFGNRKRVSDILNYIGEMCGSVTKPKLGCMRSEVTLAAPCLPVLLTSIASQANTIDMFILDPKSKSVTNLTNLPKLHIFKFWKQLYTWHTWCCLIRTRSCPQTDKRTRWNQYTLFNFVERWYN